MSNPPFGPDNLGEGYPKEETYVPGPADDQVTADIIGWERAEARERQWADGGAVERQKEAQQLLAPLMEEFRKVLGELESSGKKDWWDEYQPIKKAYEELTKLLETKK